MRDPERCFKRIASRSGYTYSTGTGIASMMKAKTTAFDSLNPSQRRAATFGTPVADQGVNAGPLLILAGAGAGHTTITAPWTPPFSSRGVTRAHTPLSHAAPPPPPGKLNSSHTIATYT